MNIQLFAEGGDGAGADGGGSGEGGGQGADNNGEGDNSGDRQPSFDDFLKNGNQAEFDKRVQKAIDVALNKAKAKWQTMTDDKLSEAEKLAKMNKEEKAEYMQRKREKELSDREAAVTKKELMAEAKGTLAEKGLPSELADLLDYTNADSCKESIEKVENAFQKAVEAAVDKKLKGGKPQTKAGDSNQTLEEQIYNYMKG